MKTSTVLGIVLAVLFSFAGVATAAGYLWARTDNERPTAARTLPTAWPTRDGSALRPVPMPSGEMVAALPPDTAGQVLCQSVSQDRWEALLGGKALREVRGSACHVITTTTDVSLAMEQSPANLQDPQDVEVAGRSAKLEFPQPHLNTRLDVRLAGAQGSEQIKPFLRVDVNGSAPALDKLTTSLAAEVVAATTKSGPALPTVGKEGTIGLERPAPAAIADLPWPMISWQLCAALTRELGGTPRPYFDGRCVVRGIEVAYTDGATPRTYTDKLTGRPAVVTDNLVAVKLTENTAQELVFTGTGHPLKALAEALVPRLLGG